MNRKFRTAIATLVATLSVAVMIDAAPAKAAPPTISASLSISPAGTGMRSVVVSGLLSGQVWVEGVLKRGSRIKVRLWGDDPIWDNLLYGPVTYSDIYVDYEVRPEGLYPQRGRQLDRSPRRGLRRRPPGELRRVARWVDRDQQGMRLLLIQPTTC